MGNDAALREATQARQRVEELSRILDHQTRVTDALSHEVMIVNSSWLSSTIYNLYN